jgi:3-methyladenine DNA glycosylase/8-oxoguanine DNA glycosylase
MRKAAEPARLSYAPAAVRYLKAADPVLARVIESVGPCRAVMKPEDTFEALLQSICYQQLAGKAAATIHGRVLALFKGAPVTAGEFGRLSDEDLRKAGLSRNKLAAMRDLAQKSRDGVVPPRAQLESLPDAQIIERLTEVRGVGVWTAQMFLMFRLGRPDVLPLDDYGIRKAFGLAFRKSGRLPPASALEKHARRWSPHRTVACWYLWRSLDGPAAL